MSARDYAARTEALLLPIVEEAGFELVDTEWVKEGPEYYLRAYIDKEGGITIDDCELVSRALEEKLDREDFISEKYILEVSSPGLDRPLKKDKDLQRSIGKEIEIKLYKPLEGEKQFVALLEGFDDENVYLSRDDRGRLDLARSDIALIRLWFTF